MSRKELHVECPCCHSRITVDHASEKVVGFERAEDLDAPGRTRRPREDVWDAAAGRVSERDSTALDKFDQALTREKRRERDLDELFERRKKRSDRDEPGEAEGGS